ncbi:MAG TPA: peptide chain release factor N(5)-glutamine methyltransferase [Gaiellaceae bacterium]|nr:peptide chain release factor N(5)-glutamine methyltransferase [Gaiellaceae bacterium]
MREALRLAERDLAAAGVDTPRVDAELLLAHVLDTSRSGVYARADAEVPDTWQVLLGRRVEREPLAYVLGEWGFRRLVLKTDARALVPRPETEIVVERALELVRGIPAPRVLDVGTGTGAIALAIADEHPGARVTAVDSSPDAVALARENAERLRLDVEVREGDLDVAAEGWDLVVSNPPYVMPDEWETLQPEIRDWEPRGALVGVGLQEKLARIAQTGLLVLETHECQARDVAATLTSLGYVDVRVTPDLAGKPRVVEGRR